MTVVPAGPGPADLVTDEAVYAAALAMCRHQCRACAADLRECDCTPPDWEMELARVALEAAAGLVAAAWQRPGR